MKSIRARFLALFSSAGALLGTCGGACGIACAAGGCCGSYALLGFIGLSGTGLKFFEKLTPFFLVLTIFSLAYAFYKAYKPKEVNCCGPENSKSESDCCKTPKRNTFFQSRSFLWAITILISIMWAYPYLSKLNNNSYNTGLEVIEKTPSDCGLSIEECCPQTVDCSTECGENEEMKK